VAGVNVPLHALTQLVAELGREVQLEQRLQLRATVRPVSSARLG
jgi:hypothetical protein